MDRYIGKQEKKIFLFKEFEYLDLIPYTIALILLVMEIYIVLQFIQLSKQGYS